MAVPTAKIVLGELHDVMEGNKVLLGNLGYTHCFFSTNYFFVSGNFTASIEREQLGTFLIYTETETIAVDYIVIHKTNVNLWYDPITREVGVLRCLKPKHPSCTLQ